VALQPGIYPAREQLEVMAYEGAMPRANRSGFASSVLYGLLPGLLLAGVTAARGADRVEGAILGLIMAAVLFGLPWLLACATNAAVLVTVRSKVPNVSPPVLFLVALVAGTVTTAAFYSLFLRGLLAEQQNCDSVCLGLEQVTLGRPYWHWILLSLWLGAVFQALPFSRNERVGLES